MRAIAVLCIAVSMPGTIIAAALYPTIRDNATIAGVLIGVVGLGAVAVGLALANAIENGVNAWGAARGIQAVTGGRMSAPDVIDLQARLARVELDRARTDDTRARTPTAPPLLGAPVPTFGGDVMYVGEVDA